MVLPRNNPFAAERLDALEFRPQGVSWEELVARFRQWNYRGLIVGPEGRGKTKLLRRLYDWCREQGQPAGALRLAFAQRRITKQQRAFVADLPDDAVLFVDSLEQLDWIGWWRLRGMTRRLQGLVATSHWRGRLPVLLECRTSLSLLEELVAELTGGDNHSQDMLSQLFDKHRGDVRRCLRALYDWKSVDKETAGNC